MLRNLHNYCYGIFRRLLSLLTVWLLMSRFHFLLRVLPIAFFVQFASSASAQGYTPSGAVPARENLVFGVHPYTNPQDLFDAYAPIMRYLEKKIPGTRFQVEGARDYADFEYKLAAGRYHFALPNPAQTVTSLAQGYRVIAKMTPDDDFRGIIIVRADRVVSAPKQLVGKSLCFTSDTAVAATMLPLLYLHEHGLNVAKDIQIRHVGSQFSSILNALTDEYAACGSTVRFWRAWSRDHPKKAEKMRILWRTEPLPHNGVVARNDVAPDLARQVAEALAGMDKDQDLDQKQFRIDQQHFELATDAAYKPVIEFLRRYDQAIGLPERMKLQPAR